MSTVFQSFLSGEENATALFRADFRIKAARIATVVEIKNKPLHETTLKVLERLNAGVSKQVDDNLSNLRAASCAVVITGQQLGVLGGPLLTLYKILSTVKIAAELQHESGCTVVPLFWLQSEDHDFDEISSASVLTSSGELRSFGFDSLKEMSGDSVGRILIKQETEASLKEFLDSLGPLNQEIAELLVKSYSANQNLSCAFRTLWQQICAPLGVLFFDPTEPEIKDLANNLIKRSFEQHSEISRLLTLRAAQLKSKSYEVQVAIKPESPLWFLSNNKRRERGVLKDNKFQTSSLSIGYSELLSLLSKEPWLFSSSALIRPIFQDWLFPTAAYVCGPSEFNYWAELQPLYDFFGLLQPLVIPRASFLLVEEKYKKLIAKSGCTLDDAFRPIEEVIKDRFQSTDLDSSILFSFLDSNWSKDLEALKAKFTKIDQNLLGPLTHTEDGIRTSLSRLKARYERSLLEKESTSVKQMHRVQTALQPNGIPQERILSAIGFLLKYGQPLIEQLLEAISTFEQYSQKVLYLKESTVYDNKKDTKE